jgi:heme/copper-type cytochrome/quinol oxidase subunit 2
LTVAVVAVMGVITVIVIVVLVVVVVFARAADRDSAAAPSVPPIALVPRLEVVLHQVKVLLPDGEQQEAFGGPDPAL